ncbi:MAG TPA: vanadium-dependent haloperoxidase [Chryseolinea sp.]
MKTRILLISCLLMICVPSFSERPKAVKSDNHLISDWLRLQQRLIRATTGVPHVAYSRHFAYTSIAVYEALIIGDANYKTLGGQLLGFSAKTRPASSEKYCRKASANAAFATMFRSFYKSTAKTHLIDSLENAYYAMHENSGYSKEEIDRSAVFGKSIAQHTLSWADGDGYSKQRAAYQPLAGEGRWVATPPSFAAPAIPYWTENRPMIISAVSLKAPMTFSKEKESDFYAVVNEVYNVSKNLTEEQKNIAWFWDDSPNGKYYSVFGHWASILAQLIDEKQIPLMVAAEALAKMSICQYNASIACWKGKYAHAVLRPVSYIQKYIDPSWTPVIETPPHPEYPAAHATFSAAAATALSDVLGTSLSFVDHSYDDLGYRPRSFKSFDEAAKEAGMSRLYGGIHYRPSIESGLILGRDVANEVISKLKFKSAQ